MRRGCRLSSPSNRSPSGRRSRASPLAVRLRGAARCSGRPLAVAVLPLLPSAARSPLSWRFQPEYSLRSSGSCAKRGVSLGVSSRQRSPLPLTALPQELGLACSCPAMTRPFPKSQPREQMSLLSCSLPLPRTGSPFIAPFEEYSLCGCISRCFALPGVVAKFLFSHRLPSSIFPSYVFPPPPPLDSSLPYL